METPLISVKKFNQIRKHLPTPRGRERNDDRVVLSGILWVIRHGVPWRQLPEIYGKWTTVYSRFKRWSEAGIFQKIFYILSRKLYKRYIGMIDSTYVKAHRTASSMAADKKPRLIGRSRGGLTTKIHMLADVDGKPRDVIITGGEVHDSKVAEEIIARNTMKTLLADKAYHSKDIRNALKSKGIKACIPLKSNSKCDYEFDSELYKRRHKIENMFSRIKDYRGVAFRTCRCAHTFASFVFITLIAIFY